MKIKGFVFFAFCCLLLHSVAVEAWFGRTQPVLNLEQVPVVTGSGETPTLEQVRRAIVEGASYKRWTLQDIEPGHLVATIHVRKHMAEVDITFDRNHYNIHYRDSDTLRYDGEEIHRNYNRWIQYMSDEINKRLLRL